MAYMRDAARTVKIDRANIDAQAPGESDKDLFITIFTDGSYCQKTKAYGIGVWIRDGSKPAITFGEGGIGANDSGHVESIALNKAKQYALDNCDVEGRVIVIQCDNIGSLNSLDIRPFKKKGAKFVKKKHVKGHTNHKTKRSKVNYIVDEIAGVWMRKYRAKAEGF